MNLPAPTLRQRAGTLLLDSPRGAWPLFFGGVLAGGRWTRFHNRNERMIAAPSGPGLACDWRWTSELNLCRCIPRAGRRLMRGALRQWPVRMAPRAASRSSAAPRISFVVGHRGADREPHLRATLASLLAQEGCAFEVLVVEEAWKPVLEGRLPGGVRWIAAPPAARDAAYSRSRAFNAGAREARGEILVLHDNDVLAPAGYGREVAAWIDRGYEAVSLQRFVFYLDAASSSRVVSGRLDPSAARPAAVRQNCEGHTIGVRRDAYFRLGGHDEAFLGWGGEDNEFFDRVRSLRFRPFGYLPFLHLDHPPSPGRERAASGNPLLDERMGIPRDVRIEALRARMTAAGGAE